MISCPPSRTAFGQRVSFRTYHTCTIDHTRAGETLNIMTTSLVGQDHKTFILLNKAGAYGVGVLTWWFGTDDNKQLQYLQIAMLLR